jgi:hypothetical protein
MNRLYVVFLFFLVLNPAFAQYEFAPIGAEWYYTKTISYNPPVFGYIKHKCIKDSVVQGQKVKVLEVTHSFNDLAISLIGYEYLMQKGDSIFYWKGNTFHLLYNFSLQKGDSLLLYSEMANACFDKTNYGWNRIDSVFSKKINNIELKAYNSSGINNSVWGFYEPTVEAIGNLGYLFPQNLPCGVYDVPIYGSLRCYSDHSIGYFSADPSLSCDSTSNFPDDVGVFRQENFFSVYPNPTKGLLFAEFRNNDEYADFKMGIYDLLGMKKMEVHVKSDKMTIDLSKMPKGNYFVVLKSNNKILGYEKIYKK